VRIGGLDYSRPDFKTMFANYGLTAIAAVSLEKSLLLLMASIDNLGNGHLPKEALHSYLNKYRKKGIGPLIDELKKRIHFPDGLEAKLEKARSERNLVIHHFFTDEYETVILPNGPTLLSSRLRPIRNFFAEVHSEVDHLLELISAELSKPRDQIAAPIKRMLKGKRAV
jgi:hypothetical protein